MGHQEKDPRPYRTKYPGFTDEAYADMEKKRSGPIPKVRQETALRLFADGYGRHDICKGIKTSSSALSISLAHDPDFARRWNDVKKARARQIDDTMIEACLRGQREVITTQSPLKDRQGNLVYKNGKQQFYISSIVTKDRPASNELIMFVLKNTNTKYGAEKTSEDNVSVEALKDLIKIKIPDADPVRNSANTN